MDSRLIQIHTINKYKEIQRNSPLKIANRLPALQNESIRFVELQYQHIHRFIKSRKITKLSRQEHLQRSLPINTKIN